MNGSHPTARSLVLARGGTLACDIRVPALAEPAVEFAAEEFRRHICQIAGASSCIRAGGTPVYIQDPEAAARVGIRVEALRLGPEDFHVQTRGEGLHILGGGQRGTLYGVYEVLERLGCRWYTPTLKRIPRCDDVYLSALRATGRPAFEYRDNFNWETADPLWRVRNRMNGWQPRIPLYMGGHNNYGLWCHTFFELVKPSEHFAQHPEFFSMIGGVRTRNANQLCLSNHEVRRLLTRNLLARIRAQPRDTIFSVSQNDGMGPCECPACRAIVAEEGSESGPILRFVNAVAAEVARQFPGKLIDTIAYLYSVEPPRKVRPAPNVRVRLCAFNCCQGHALGTCDQLESRQFLRALDGWARICPQLYIWHYCTNFTHYPLPMPNLEEIHADIARYARRGVYGIFMQGQGDAGGGAELSALRGYLIGRLLWNPRQPLRPIVDDFLAAGYGAAAPALRRYIDLFQRAVSHDRALHVSLGESPVSRLYAERRLGEADRILAVGERRVSGPEKERVRLLRAGLDYARLLRVAKDYRLRGTRYQGKPGRAERRLFQKLAGAWRQAGVEHLSEGTPIQKSLERLHMRLEPHAAVWLRQDGQSVVIVPALGGRLLEWHACGRQWFAFPPENRYDYPCPDGYSEVCGYVTGSLEPYRASRQGKGWRLSADLENGLRQERRLRFEDGWLRIDSLVANRSSAIVRSSWGAGLRFLCPAPAALELDGGPALSAETLSGPDGRFFEGSTLPKAWTVATGGFHIEHRFEGTLLFRARAKVEAADRSLTLYLCTDHFVLAPGAVFNIAQHIRISRVERES